MASLHSRPCDALPTSHADRASNRPSSHPRLRDCRKTGTLRSATQGEDPNVPTNRNTSVSRTLILVALMVPSACADDGTAAFDCTLKSGLWRAKYTLRAGSSSDCDQVPDRTIQIGGLSGSAGDSSTCDLGCSCTSNSNDTSCSSTYVKTCDPEFSNSCDFHFESATAGRGVCVISDFDISCTVDIVVTWEAP